jgi:hypothetical protein
MKVIGSGVIGETPVHYRHEQFREGWCHSYTTIVVWHGFISFALV